MSRVGKNPVVIPDKVKVTMHDSVLEVEGPKGKLNLEISPKIRIEIKGKEILVKRLDNHRNSRSIHGLTRTIIANTITGVAVGFVKTLEVNGMGYRTQTKDNLLNLILGYSHPIQFPIPEGIEIKVDKNQIEVSGYDKQKVGEIAAKIRRFRPPEPYKGKGIKYVDEKIIRKVGKVGAAGGKTK
ncbi:MAG: 50S ribosomal protein L6 [Thermodesulfobacteriota bacterium]|nr:50S ribosomal protein L6 [Thermodesulfobacteriota bacterium]